MANELVNVGFLHEIKCEWCGLKMSCNCLDGNDLNRQGHILVLCPRCQVTDLLNVLFGEQDLRSVLISKIQEARGQPNRQLDMARPQLKLVVNNDGAGAIASTLTKP